MTPEIFNTIGFFIFITGLCIGSFLNVVALRALTGESIVLPPSKCPKCGEKIKPWDNIPVISYIILRGKCRNCKTPISIQYPIVELITGLGFFFLFQIFGPFLFEQPFVWQKALLLPIFIIVFSLSTVISITDIKEQVVFDVHTISLLVVIILFKFLEGLFTEAVIGMLAGAAIMEIFSGIGWIFTKKRAFGTGDTFIAASIGAFLGLKMLVIALITAVIIQVAGSLIPFMKKLAKNKEYKLLTLFALFSLILLFYKLPVTNNFNYIIKYLFVILITVVGIYLCKLLLSLKSLKDNPTYWPFGPSLLVAMFLTAFFGDAIQYYFLSLLF